MNRRTLIVAVGGLGIPLTGCLSQGATSGEQTNSPTQSPEGPTPTATETRTPSDTPSPTSTPAGPFTFATVHNAHDTTHHIIITISRVSTGVTLFETDRQIPPGYENHVDITDEWVTEADTYRVHTETEAGRQTAIEVDADETWACDHSVGIEITDDGQLISTIAVGSGKAC